MITIEPEAKDVKPCHYCGTLTISLNTKAVTHYHCCPNCYDKLVDHTICYLCGSTFPSNMEYPDSFVLDNAGHAICNSCYFESLLCRRCGIWHSKTEPCPVSPAQSDFLDKLTVGQEFIFRGYYHATVSRYDNLFKAWILMLTERPQIDRQLNMIVQPTSMYSLYLDPCPDLTEIQTDPAAVQAWKDHNDRIFARLTKDVAAEAKRREKLILFSDMPKPQPLSDVYPSKYIDSLVNLSLSQQAADYYTLLNLEIDFPDDPQISALLKTKEDRLAEQFEAYLILAIGGETRYFPRQDNFKKLGGLPKSQVSKTALKLLPFIINSEESQRISFWRLWEQLVQKFGVNRCLSVAYQLFSLPKYWSGKIGGAPWASAVKLLLRYRTGKISKRIFVDSAWALEHNSNCIYDKYWDVAHVKWILDANLNDRVYTTGFASYCSPAVRRLLEKHNIKLIPYNIAECDYDCSECSDSDSCPNYVENDDEEE